MKFSIMYLAGKVNGREGYRQLQSSVLSEETQAKVIEEINLYLGMNNEEVEGMVQKAKGDSNDLR